ncbi:hypothetical protein AGABI2DRAFT_138136 [Agaricus bisporus var. bisporus H97]|uniref:hypothetical protein n=1 Tax=Agaricus bisporus var. bisporus (strain H97 / ATCC MYA-4626 / FGSC 10389) TaxID=936046 RepID=UPI00029F768A|nr:hypothetical protein AGABI2DRAFT_138136 [Agaricus bisporus var. bisporus H97]EKV44536.1 hypothetical protein AGABI2DRAFT_138136 [Agaricus bisporus var. bisporus H97]
MLRIPLLLFALSGVLAINFRPLDGRPGLVDNGTFGPEVEVVHLFQGDAPIGVVISKTGRAFVTFNRGNLDQSPLTLVEIVNDDGEVAFPTEEFNTPPGGLTNSTSGRTVGSSDSEHVINAQGLIVDSKDRLWVLDKGRPSPGGDNLLAAPGGPKLMGFDLGANATTPFKTITFPERILPPTGYLNDVRIDLTPSLTDSGEGVAYIADSGGFGIIVVDLGTDESWRHLNQLKEVSLTSRFLPTFFGAPTFAQTPGTPSIHYQTAGGGGGIDGITISPDGKFIYFTPIASRDLYRVETSALRRNTNNDTLAFLLAADSVQFLGEVGGQADGLESDNTGKIYISSPEHNSINVFDPDTGLVSVFVRSPILAWADTMSVADDGFIYATVNQLWLSAGFQNGVDKRTRPFALVRIKIDGERIPL